MTKGAAAGYSGSNASRASATHRRPAEANAGERAIRRAWTYFDRSIDTLVARLRKKIDLDPAHPLIRSVRGVGYVFCAIVTGTPDSDQKAAIATRIGFEAVPAPHSPQVR